MKYSKLKTWACSLNLLLLLTACGESSTTIVQSDEQVAMRALLDIPGQFALPVIPEFNQPTEAKIALGRRLFYDTKLSANETQSCSSCHLQSMAFTDGVDTPTGSTGDRLKRNSQGLANVAYHSSLTWASTNLVTLEEQLNIPIRSDNPIELGVTDSEIDTVLARFDNDTIYPSLFANAFPESETGTTINKIIFALASFCRTIISGESAYDSYLLGDEDALTEQQKHGLALFNGEKFECFHCHNGVLLSTSYQDQNSAPENLTQPHFNNGLYNVGGTGDYPADDQGLFELTANPNHRGLFRPPSLRNAELTAPYMHDGSIATLEEVIKHYARGGTLTAGGPNAGDGKFNPLKSGLIQGFNASDQEIEDIIAFIESLTDTSLTLNPNLSDPFVGN